MLDLIEAALQKHDIAFQRIDGQSSLLKRRQALDQFNTSKTRMVMLASIGAVGEG
jgi:SNF2 family DNA or RNA helicase